MSGVHCFAYSSDGLLLCALLLSIEMLREKPKHGVPPRRLAGLEHSRSFLWCCILGCGFFFFWVEQCLDCCLKGFGKPLLHRIVCRISAPKTGASGEVKNDFPKLGIWVGGQFFVRFFKARERVTYFLCFVVPHWLPSAGSQLSSWSWTEIVFMISTEDIELAATCDTLDCFLSSSKFVKCPLIICCQKSAAGGPLFCF